MFKGCINPPYIHRGCIDSCNNFNIQKHSCFDLLKNYKTIQKRRLGHDLCGCYSNCR